MIARCNATKSAHTAATRNDKTKQKDTLSIAHLKLVALDASAVRMQNIPGALCLYEGTGLIILKWHTFRNSWCERTESGYALL